jgi:hypothetical protein
MMVMAWTWRKKMLPPFQVTPHNSEDTQAKEQKRHGEFIFEGRVAEKPARTLL